MEEESQLTEQEVDILHNLGRCFTDFVALEEYHRDDVEEFRRAIHAAQNIISARVAVRTNPLVYKHLKAKI